MKTFKLGTENFDNYAKTFPIKYVAIDLDGGRILVDCYEKSYYDEPILSFDSDDHNVFFQFDEPYNTLQDSEAKYAVIHENMVLLSLGEPLIKFPIFVKKYSIFYKFIGKCNYIQVCKDMIYHGSDNHFTDDYLKYKNDLYVDITEEEFNENYLKIIENFKNKIKI